MRDDWIPARGDRVRIAKNLFHLVPGQRVDLPDETGTVMMFAASTSGGDGRGCDVLVELDRPRELWDGNSKRYWWCGFDELEPLASDETNHVKEGER